MDRKSLFVVILGTCAVAFVIALIVLGNSNPKPKTATPVTPTKAPGEVIPTPTFPPSEPQAARIAQTEKTGTPSAVKPTKTNKVARLFTVEITAKGFNPETVTISTGDVVTWTNKDTVSHKIVGKTWKSGPIAQSKTFAQQFDFTGTYTYFSENNPNLTGKIIVE